MFKLKEGGFQRKPFTYFELTNFKHFEGFWESCHEKMYSFYNQGEVLPFLKIQKKERNLFKPSLIAMLEPT